MKKYASFTVCCLFFITCLVVIFSTDNWRRRQLISWDVAGYQLYLSGAIVYQDLYQLGFYPKIDSQYRPSGDMKNYAIFSHPGTGRKFIKYTCGVALFQLPAFLVAHGYASFSGDYPADGYSPPYRLALLINGCLFAFAGLLLLRLFLRHYFNDAIVALVLLILGFGTNILVYSCIEAGLSHIYLFFLYALILRCTQGFYKQPTIRLSAGLGLAIGLCTLMRPTDFLIILVPLAWGVHSKDTFLGRLNFIRRHPGALGAFLLAFLLPLSLQCLYWKATTGHFVYDSYQDYGDWFMWGRPKLFDGLFSYRKGWLVYTPLAALGVLGWLLLFRSKRFSFYVLPMGLYFLTTLYVVFCWGTWWYGGSFGCRALIQSLALLALPIGYLLHAARLRWQKLLLAAAVSFGIFLNCFQTYQWQQGFLPDQGLNRDYYWRIFLKAKVTEEDRRLL